MQAGEILSVPLDQPETLFPSLDQLDTDYRKLAKTWHPDLHPNLKESVLTHINVLYSAAKSRRDAGLPWRRFALRESGDKVTVETLKGKVEFSYRRKHTLPLGDLYVGSTHATSVIDVKHKDLWARAINKINYIKYADDKLREVHEPCMPKIRSFFEGTDKLGLAVIKRHDQILLRDVLAHCGTIDPRHVAWILSRCYSLACFFYLQNLVHCDFSLDTLYVCPERHTISPLGGWWFAYADGGREQITMLPTRTVNAVNPRLLADKLPKTAITLELIKALGRELLGDPGGARIMFDKALPQPLTRWLVLPSGHDPIKEYQVWQDKVLIDSFGPRKFLPWNLTEAEVYKAKEA